MKQAAMICSTGFESEMTAQLGSETGLLPEKPKFALFSTAM